MFINHCLWQVSILFKSKIIDLVNTNSIYFAAHIPQIHSSHLHIVENIPLPGMT